MRRRRIFKYAGSRKSFLFLLATLLLALYACWWLSEEVSQALVPPPPPDQSLHQFRANRSMQYYLDNICGKHLNNSGQFVERDTVQPRALAPPASNGLQRVMQEFNFDIHFPSLVSNLLIEPSLTCEMEQIPVLIMVTSAPSHWRQRDVIRNTWGKHQQTYFFLGLSSDDDQLVDTYIEAKQHSDLIVHELQDHYQNLTLKVALMLHWTLRRCPHAEFMFKTDDDVLVNPWTLKDVLLDNKDAALFGYKKENSVPHRDAYTKWYLPRWLYNEDLIPEYLSGTGYIIKGEHLPYILSASLRVPLINMEDVYFTYLVAKRALGLPLTHDRRLSPYKPWTSLSCPYKNLASIHSVTPGEMEQIWAKIEELRKDRDFCSVFSSSELLLY